MTSPSRNLIEIYGEKVKGLQENLENEILKEEVFQTLTLRDEIQEQLHKGEIKKLNDLEKIQEIDKKLKNKSKIISEAIPLEELRKTKKTLPEAWWWYSEKPKHRLDKWDGIYNLGTLFCLGFSFSLTIEIISRLLQNGGDITLSILAAIQASLTLWIGKSFLKDNPGETINRILAKVSDSVKIHKHLQAEFNFFLALLIAIITLAIRVYGIPLISRVYNNIGENYHYPVTNKIQDKEFSKAFFFYQIASKIDPENIRAKYNLGYLYEELSYDKKAKDFYEMAILEEYATAYNNLGRLLILENDLEKADIILTKGWQLTQKPKVRNSPEEKTKIADIQYSLLKNLGWLRLEQKINREAEDYIKQAIELNNRKGAAHCLKAKILESQQGHSKKELIQLLNSCATTYDLTKPEEIKWGREAQEKLENIQIDKP